MRPRVQNRDIYQTDNLNSNISEYYKDYNRWKKSTVKNGKCCAWNKETKSGWIKYRDNNGIRQQAHVKGEQLLDLNGGYLHIGALVRFNVIYSEKGPFAVRVKLRHDIACNNCYGIGHVRKDCKSTAQRNNYNHNDNPREYFTARY